MQEKLEKLFLIKSTIFESPFMAHFEDLVICLLTNNNNILELSSILAKHLSMYLILNPQSRNPITRLTAAIIDQKMNERNIFFLSFFHEFHVQYQLARLSHDMQDVWKSAKILIILHQLHMKKGIIYLSFSNLLIQRSEIELEFVQKKEIFLL